MKEIIQKGNPALRKKAKEVPPENITKGAIQLLLKDMRETLDGKESGIALAAPQIGSPFRIFVVAQRAFEESRKNEGVNTKLTSKKGNKDPLVYINPKIKKASKKTVELEEACLSVEDYFGTVTRAQKVTIEAYNENGVKFSRGVSGLLAQIFQHEIDHLNGILYIDHAHDIRKVEIQDE